MAGSHGYRNDPACNRCSIHRDWHQSGGWLGSEHRHKGPGPQVPRCESHRSLTECLTSHFTSSQCAGKQTLSYYCSFIVCSPCQTARGQGSGLLSHSTPRTGTVGTQWVLHKHSVIVPAVREVGWCLSGLSRPPGAGGQARSSLQQARVETTSPIPLPGRVGSHLPSEPMGAPSHS